MAFANSQAARRRLWLATLPAWARTALQQSSICGLEEPEFPYPDEACQGHSAAGTRPVIARRCHAVAVSATTSGVSAIAGGRDRDQKQGAKRGMKVLSRLAAIAGGAGAAA